jgi:putative zinc finger/helix-turn-helix YgiT family protein
MRCPNCKSKLFWEKGIHHYKECGLNNILLEGVEMCTCSCGEKIVNIPAMPNLHNVIGLDIIKKKALLNGKEVRFLRKNMGMAAKKLAEIIGVDNATISRWESDDQRISRSNDRFIRLVYSEIKGHPTEEIKHLVEAFGEIKNKKVETPSYKIPLELWSDGKVLCLNA